MFGTDGTLNKREKKENEIYLHDECTVLVALLRQCVQLGNGIVERVFGKANK